MFSVVKTSNAARTAARGSTTCDVTRLATEPSELWRRHYEARKYRVLLVPRDRAVEEDEVFIYMCVQLYTREGG